MEISEVFEKNINNLENIDGERIFEVIEDSLQDWEFSLFEKVIEDLGGDLNEDKVDAILKLYEVYSCPYGMRGGFGGLVYYTETESFYDENYASIITYVEEYVMHGGDTSIYTNIGREVMGGNYKNFIVWFVCEDIARRVMELEIGE